MHVKPLHDFDLGYINYVSRHAQKNWKDMRARNDHLLTLCLDGSGWWLVLICYAVGWLVLIWRERKHYCLIPSN